MEAGGLGLYQEFKKTCDDYFFLPARKEHRCDALSVRCAVCVCVHVVILLLGFIPLIHTHTHTHIHAAARAESSSTTWSGWTCPPRRPTPTHLEGMGRRACGGLRHSRRRWRAPSCQVTSPVSVGVCGGVGVGLWSTDHGGSQRMIDRSRDPSLPSFWIISPQSCAVAARSPSRRSSGSGCSSAGDATLNSIVSPLTGPFPLPNSLQRSIFFLIFTDSTPRLCFEKWILQQCCMTAASSSAWRAVALKA